MSYATRDNMISRFGADEVIKLTDPNHFGVIDDAVLNVALADADAEIDPYLAPCNKLPLTSVPKVITRLACDIARYHLCSSGVTETEEVRNRYKDAVRFLEHVASGKIGLGLDAANNVIQPASLVQFSTPGGRVFDRGSRG